MSIPQAQDDSFCPPVSAGADGRPLAGRRRAGASRQASSPRPVTRGESSTKTARSHSRAKVDWLSATFEPGSLGIPGLIGLIGAVMQLKVMGQDVGHGIHGFEDRTDLYAYVRGALVRIGFIARGGESQRGKWLLDLTGKACGLVKDWGSIRCFLEDVGATLTRLDLAVDFLEGEYQIEDAVAMYREGDFTTRGRPPTTKVDGDWLDGVKGRTLYVGKVSNGKGLCVYEKGKQLGDLQSEWLRFELRLGNRDRTIPLDAIENPDPYFAGAYPALEKILSEVVAEPIATEQEESAISLAHGLHHLRRCFGKFLHLATDAGVPNADLIEELTVKAFPRRVDPAGVAAGLEASELMARVRSIRQ